MKQVVLLFCLFAFLSAHSQSTVSESHDFITYDTTVAYHGLAGVNWYLRISRPANLFKAGSPDTASRPALISMPGIGEVGSDPDFLTRYGPHYWLNNGWDGSVQLGNGIHYPIIITIAQGITSSSPYYLSILMDSLKRWYHIKPRGVHVAGLSMGAFEWGDLICYAGFNGDEHAMSGITSYVALSGEGSTYDGNNFGFNLPGFTAYTVWAQKYGGKLWSMQGTNDDRYDYDVRDAMALGSPGSGYFAWTSDGGGTHCCWNDEYNPSTNNWQCVAPITNHNIALSSQPNSMGTYKQGSNLFQWMLRQGDTSLAGATAAVTTSTSVSHLTPVVNAGANQTITLPTSSATLTGSAAETGGAIASYLWTKVSGYAGATISTATTASTTIKVVEAGTYVFKLLATDKSGDTASSMMEVLVEPAVSHLTPVVNAGANQTITLPTSSATLTGSAAETGGTIASYLWTKVSGYAGATISTATTASTTIKVVEAGTYVFKLLATDKSGDTASSMMEVLVKPAVSHLTPVVNAGANQTITLPTSSATLTGSATETGGAIASYLWTKVSGYAGATISTATTASTTIKVVEAGTYVFKLLATDKSGDTASSMVEVLVKPAVAQPVTTSTSMATTTTSGKGTYITNVIVAEYRTWYVTNTGSIYAYNNNNASFYPVQFPIGGSTFNGGAGGFNYFRVLDNSGYVWTSRIDYTTNSDRILTDTTGAPFSGNWYIDGYGHVALTIRPDSSVWYFGVDAYSLFYPGGNLVDMTGVTMAPTRLSPVGMKFKKVLFGGNGIIGLTTTGQVYKWFAGGSRTPTLMTTPRPAIDVFISHLDVDGCIIPDPGETSGMGYPYVWGGSTSMYGGGAPYTEPTSIKSLWKMTVPIKQISVDWNTIHYIDSLGNMYGTGFNSFGEVGNGQEFVNKYNYPGFPGYGWDMVDYENPTGLPVQIGKGVKWKHIFSNNWFSFYKYAQDENDSIYSWGRNKSLDLGNGKWGGYTSDAYHPNSLDVLQPTMVHPLTTPLQQYGWIAPTISAGPKQKITTTTVELKGTAQPLLLIADNPTPAINGIDTAGYHVVAWQWTKVSGNGGTILTPTSNTTSVTGLSTGTYVFQLVTTDNNTGTLMARDTVIVTSTTSTASTLTANAGSAQTISLPTNSVTLTGSAAEIGGGIESYAWTEVSGPAQYSFSHPGERETVVSNLEAGTYVFRLIVTDTTGATATATVTITVNSKVSTAADNGTTIPGTIKAADYATGAGMEVQETQATSDAGGGLNVGWITEGDFMIYNVDVLTAGTYTVGFRVATPYTGATFQLQNSTGKVLASVKSPNTGGFQDWATTTATVTLPAGQQALKIVSTSPYIWNINWMEFTLASTTALGGAGTADLETTEPAAFGTDSTGVGSNPAALLVYPNPVRDNVTLYLNDGHTGQFIVQVMNPSGAILRTYSFTKDQSLWQGVVSLGNLPMGVYFLRISGENWQEVKKLIKL